MVPSFVKFQVTCIHYRSVPSNSKACYMLKDSKESEGMFHLGFQVGSHRERFLIWPDPTCSEQVSMAGSL